MIARGPTDLDGVVVHRHGGVSVDGDDFRAVHKHVGVGGFRDHRHLRDRRKSGVGERRKSGAGEAGEVGLRCLDCLADDLLLHACTINKNKPRAPLSPGCVWFGTGSSLLLRGSCVRKTTPSRCERWAAARARWSRTRRPLRRRPRGPWIWRKLPAGVGRRGRGSGGMTEVGGEREDGERDE